MAFLLTFDIQSCDLGTFPASALGAQARNFSRENSILFQTASSVWCWLIIAASISASSRFD
jgi:hypothetical protein